MARNRRPRSTSFPEELRGMGEGSRMMAPSASASRMTNGSVSTSRMTNGTASQSRMSNGSVSSTSGTSLAFSTLEALRT